MTDLERDELVRVARSWDGTPFHWQQATRGQGSDCKGWIVGTALECGRPEAQSIEALMVGDHACRVPIAQLRLGLRRLFDRVDIARPADILLLRVGDIPQHLAMYLGRGQMMHCWAKSPRRVHEVPMHEWWRAVDSVWSWRAL